MKTSTLRDNKFLATSWRLRRGITLIEILVVICIIAVLGFIGFPMVTKMRDKGKSVTCIGNVKQVGMAIIMYAGENSDMLPPLDNIVPGQSGNKIWPQLLADAGYLNTSNDPNKYPCGEGVWTCPACDFMQDTFGGYGVSEGIFDYLANSATSAGRLSKIQDPANTWLVGDVMKDNNPKKGWYAIWQNPSGWAGGDHAPAKGRHPNNLVNVCMFDGHVESLTAEKIREGKYTYHDKSKAP